MSEDRMAYGNEAKEWERDAQELRALMESGGYTQVAAGKELDLSERVMREYCSGRGPVPRAVLYAMRWLVEHKPNAERWLQVHWKKAGRQVKGDDRFEIRAVNGDMRFLVNGEVVIHGHLEDLIERGLVTMHKSYSPDRFLWNPSTV